MFTHTRTQRNGYVIRQMNVTRQQSEHILLLMIYDIQSILLTSLASCFDHLMNQCSLQKTIYNSCFMINYMYKVGKAGMKVISNFLAGIRLTVETSAVLLS